MHVGFPWRFDIIIFCIHLQVTGACMIETLLFSDGESHLDIAMTVITVSSLMKPTVGRTSGDSKPRLTFLFKIAHTHTPRQVV